MHVGRRDVDLARHDPHALVGRKDAQQTSGKLGNRILDALTKRDRDALVPHLHEVELAHHALFSQLAQNAGCNRCHDVEQRCARWLLMTHDRVVGDDLPLTHEFLAQVLGVRSVDREVLEHTSCACYAVTRRELERLLP